jgi:hypothetical protein
MSEQRLNVSVSSEMQIIALDPARHCRPHATYRLPGLVYVVDLIEPRRLLMLRADARVSIAKTVTEAFIPEIWEIRSSSQAAMVAPESSCFAEQFGVVAVLDTLRRLDYAINERLWSLELDIHRLLASMSGELEFCDGVNADSLRAEVSELQGLEREQDRRVGENLMSLLELYQALRLPDPLPVERMLVPTFRGRGRSPRAQRFETPDGAGTMVLCGRLATKPSGLVLGRDSTIVADRTGSELVVSLRMGDAGKLPHDDRIAVRVGRLRSAGGEPDWKLQPGFVGFGVLAPSNGFTTRISLTDEDAEHQSLLLVDIPVTAGDPLPTAREILRRAGPDLATTVSAFGAGTSGPAELVVRRLEVVKRELGISEADDTPAGGVAGQRQTPNRSGYHRPS